jgi:hypothetical protein
MEHAGFISSPEIAAQNSGRMDEPRAVRDRLCHGGWDEVALAGVTDLPWDRVLEILAPVVGRLSFGEELELRAVLSRAALQQDLSNRAFATQAATFFVDEAWNRRYGRDAETPLAPLIRWEAVQRKAPAAKWPSRFQRGLEHLRDGDSREKLESKERERVVHLLASALCAAGLWRPDADEEGKPASVLVQQRIAMGRRLGTLRQHVRNISRMAQFCTVSFGYGWFRQPRDFFDLISSRLAEPCGKHVPRALFNSVIFAEQAAELEEGLRLSKNQGVRNFLKEVESAGGWKTGRVVKKAQPFGVVMILALEDLVMRSAAQAYMRWYAWIKLLKVWAALRWSDLQGIPNDFLHLRHDGVLEGKITRSKTSGQGKRVEVMYFYVAPEAFLLCKNWLRTGWELNLELSRQSGLHGRDYMVPKPTVDLSGFRKAIVKYQDAVTMSRALLLALRAEVHLEGQEGPGESRALLIQMATGFWTEHSERGTMATYMQMSQVAPEIRKMVGRWSFSQEEEYMRHLETSIRGAQAKVAAFLKSWDPSLRVLEDQIIANLGNYLRERGVQEDAIGDIAQNLALPKDETADVANDMERLEGLRRVLQVEDEALSGRATSQYSPSVGFLAQPEEIEETEDEGEGDGEPMIETTGTFVFSIVGSCHRRTLHRVGECWRVPGVHYRNYLSAGNDRPPLAAGDRECRDCFRRNRSMEDEEEDELAMTSSSSSQEED